jgi:small subunit ribosomal protein S16
LYWLGVGALPTDTCRLILSNKGVLLKKHLLEGVKKGALTQETADAEFDKWFADKDAKVQAEKIDLEQSARKEQNARIEAENKVREAKEAEIAKKKLAGLAAQAEVEAAPETEAAESPES